MDQTYDPRATRRNTVHLHGPHQDLYVWTPIDAGGRILIPPELRGYAQLEKKLVLVGRSQRLEIWSEENWNTEREKSQATYRSMLLDRDNMSDALKNLSW